MADRDTARLVDEARAARARGRGERLDSQAFLMRELGVEPVSEVSEEAAAEPRREVVPGSGPGTKTSYDMGSGGRGIPILPAGRIQLPSGKNEYWKTGTCEVWDEGGKLFAVFSSYDKPYHAIGARADFSHDQTFRRLRTGATMVGWFTLDPNGKQGGRVPASGSLPVATYK